MRGWTVKFCSGTVSTKVTLQSGPNDHDNAVWGDWFKGGPDELRLPEDQQGLNHIWLMGVNAEHHQVEMCVMYNGQCKRRYSFDGQHEAAEVDVSDNDNCPC